jgi:hypothetical protein
MAAGPELVASVALSRRGMVRGLAALAVTMSGAGQLLAQGAAGGGRPVPGQAVPLATPRPVTVTARPLAGLERADPGRRHFGRLEFRGGLVLTSPSGGFGGWSGLVADERGRRVLAISDRGDWLSADVGYVDGRPGGFQNAVMGPIVGTDGRPLRGRDADAESIALLDGTLARGTVLIAFERSHRIGRYPVGPGGLGPPLGFLRMPADLARAVASNRGIEAVCVISAGPRAGSIIAFAEEGFDARRNHTGWLWPDGISGEPVALGLTNIDDFAVTDVAALPDGSLIVLERKFRWTEGVKMRLRHVPATAVAPGALIEGEVLVEAGAGFEIDNMEGLAVSRDARGLPLLTIISDNNFNALLQRTVLLQFALLPHAPAGTR